MIINCHKCGEELATVDMRYRISGSVHMSDDYCDGPVEARLNGDKVVVFSVCKNTACERNGILVIASRCPIYLDGHRFIQCDEWGRTCLCGKPEDEG